MKKTKKPGKDGGSSGCYLCFGVVMVGITTMFYCVSFPTSSWLTGQVHEKDIRIGLWEICLDDICLGLHEDDHQLLDTLGVWVEVCEVLGILAITLWCCGILNTGAYLFSSKYTLLRLTAFILFISAALYVSCLIIFALECYKVGLMGSSYNSPLRFGVSLYAAAFAVVCGICSGALYLNEYYKGVNNRSGYIMIN